MPGHDQTDIRFRRRASAVARARRNAPRFSALRSGRTTGPDHRGSCPLNGESRLLRHRRPEHEPHQDTCIDTAPIGS